MKTTRGRRVLFTKIAESVITGHLQLVWCKNINRILFKPKQVVYMLQPYCSIKTDICVHSSQILMDSVCYFKILTFVTHCQGNLCTFMKSNLTKPSPTLSTPKLTCTKNASTFCYTFWTELRRTKLFLQTALKKWFSFLLFVQEFNTKTPLNFKQMWLTWHFKMPVIGKLLGTTVLLAVNVIITQWIILKETIYLIGVLPDF